MKVNFARGDLVSEMTTIMFYVMSFIQTVQTCGQWGAIEGDVVGCEGRKP